jgi:hypothetical protein
MALTKNSILCAVARANGYSLKQSAELVKTLIEIFKSNSQYSRVLSNLGKLPVNIDLKRVLFEVGSLVKGQNGGNNLAYIF